MSVVILSPSTEHPREFDILRELIAAGLEKYHLRKPEWREPEKFQRWLDKLDRPDWVAEHLILSVRPEMKTANLNVLGFHVSGGLRKASGGMPPGLAQGRDVLGYPISTSAHSIMELREVADEYDVAYVGPVFESVTKPGYGPTIGMLRYELPENIKVYAIGGITKENIGQVRAAGWHGAVTLGGVWEDKAPVKAFEALNQAWKSSVPSS